MDIAIKVMKHAEYDFAHGDSNSEESRKKIIKTIWLFELTTQPLKLCSLGKVIGQWS